ncbi:glycosyltransferase [Gordonia jinghuaiqii]|uniref:Glycosyltransferase family 2 protein n=1 Tax=Gordonia jinghuaiqii TaxID=2758710 RepID=A0A7D7QIV2_9ACTN|nr:glycosyltransferase [Gordonia jinghuaiqii]MCR5977951.1 glycosyltransferase [Gordonia jinghuaiqii]QMT02604.1 glycosyltransferase family 2 protein [Gordonia jinghuaiqii]
MTAEPARIPEVEAAKEHFRSVDSTPVRYARPEPAARVNGFLLAFAGCSLIVQLTFTVLANTRVGNGNRDLVFFTGDGLYSLMPVRLFLLTFFIVFAFWIHSNLWRRLLIAVELVAGVLISSLLIDFAALMVGRFTSVTIEVFAQQVLTALLALVLFPIVLCTNAVLPPAGPLPKAARQKRIRWHSWVRLVIPLGVAFAVATWVEVHWVDQIGWMRSAALLGGVGPGVFLAQQAFIIQVALIGLVLVTRSRRRGMDFAPDLAILVPAHNEAHSIADTIAAAGEAARRYAGKVRIYVVDNLSTDDTIAVARAAIAANTDLVGEVLECREPGKAIALNSGIAQITEDFLVRIDADTIIGPSCLAVSMRHLADPDVGAVGGLPLPTERRTYIDRVRLIEVLLRHAFYQVGLNGFDGVMGVPGMLTVYRRAALDAAGPIVQGMNGEDTDICLRISAAGYRVIADPAVVYWSETPQSWAHLREQRTRWFRSIYHVAGHNRKMLLNTHSMAGAVTLPFQLASAARRAMFAPLLVAATIALLVFGPTFPGLRWVPVIATILGLPLLVAILVCMLARQWRALLYIPEYLTFRIIRSWFTLGAAMTLVFPPLEPRFRWGRAESVSAGEKRP